MLETPTNRFDLFYLSFKEMRDEKYSSNLSLFNMSDKKICLNCYEKQYIDPFVEDNESENDNIEINDIIDNEIENSKEDIDKIFNDK